VTIAALYVDARGCYAGINGVEIWDEKRDARLYEGPYAVVAHPPCTRWCRLAGLVEARYGHRKGDDGGCFAAALASVRRWGGVLEHPAWSDAWAAHDLNAPPPSGGWVRADFLGGWTCQVEQGRYGHPARKATWLFAFGCELPSLRWGSSAQWKGPSVSGMYKGRAALVGFAANHTNRLDDRPRVSKRAASATPADFRDVLLGMARSCEGGGCGVEVEPSRRETRP
jgi:hypothetical protein